MENGNQNSEFVCLLVYKYDFALQILVPVVCWRKCCKLILTASWNRSHCKSLLFLSKYYIGACERQWCMENRLWTNQADNCWSQPTNWLPVYCLLPHIDAVLLSPLEHKKTLLESVIESELKANKGLRYNWYSFMFFLLTCHFPNFSTVFKSSYVSKTRFANFPLPQEIASLWTNFFKLPCRCFTWSGVISL